MVIFKVSLFTSKHSVFFARIIFILLIALQAWGRAQYTPPDGYYAAAEALSGPALKAALHSIIRNHTVIPYTATWTDAWDALKVLDQDPANPVNVRLIYSNGSVPAWDTAGNGNTSITENSWAREHFGPSPSASGARGPTPPIFSISGRSVAR